jgi:hypothetical protein
MTGDGNHAKAPSRKGKKKEIMTDDFETEELGAEK